MKIVILMLPVLALLLMGCGDKKTVESAPEIELERGSASYYSDSLAGNATASGERYNPDELVAAHREHPFGTVLRVARADNDERAVAVTVIDRGPQDKDHLIDLSRAAAQRLQMIDEGHVDVTIEVLRAPLEDPDPRPAAPAADPSPSNGTVVRRAPPPAVDRAAVAPAPAPSAPRPAPPPAARPRQTPQPASDSSSSYAGYISDRYQGGTTASGARYSKWQMTAAHANYPFGTEVEVTNLSNNKKVRVKIIDRGPKDANRINLSYAAAKEIGVYGEGLAKVRIRKL